MKKMFLNLVTGILLMRTFGGVAFAQTPNPSEKVPVKLLIVISRYDGDRKLSSLPFTMLAIANGGQSTLNNGVNMPLSNVNTVDNKTTTSVSYTNIGTTIQGTVATDSGSFKVTLNVDDKSVVDVPSPPAGSGAKSPAFRSLSFVGVVNLKEGEAKQIMSVADRASGEVSRIDITLTLDK